MFVLNYTQGVYKPDQDVGSHFDTGNMPIAQRIPTILRAIFVATILFALMMPYLETHRMELAKTIETERINFKAMRVKDLQAIQAAEKERDGLQRTLAYHRKRSAMPEPTIKHFSSMVVEVGRPICICGRYA
jgi:hypothetical protein